jgi:hypothetical protein
VGLSTWPQLAGCLKRVSDARHRISIHPFTGRLPAEIPSGECSDTPGDTRRPLADRSAALRVVSGHLTGASHRALRQDPAEVAVLRPELDASGVIRPGLAALRAGPGQLLVPSDPTIAAVGKVSHITEANPEARSFRAGRTRSRCLPTASSMRLRRAGLRVPPVLAPARHVRQLPSAAPSGSAWAWT